MSGGLLGRALSGAAAAAGAEAAYRALTAATDHGLLGGPVTWRRTNHRGEPVTLLEGPAYAVAATLSAALAPGLPTVPRVVPVPGGAGGTARRARLAVVTAATAAAALGGYDDLAGSGDDRGFRGHLGALARGQVTTGTKKIAGIGAAGLLAGALLRGRSVDAVLAGGVVAGTANLVNLLDLRPGRAIKVALVLSTPALLRHGLAGALLAGPAGAAAGLLRHDLRERAMLGDAGANAMGALLGVAAAASASRPTLLAEVAALVALTAASEKVSFTRVIEATPVLRELDALGRRPFLDGP